MNKSKLSISIFVIILLPFLSCMSIQKNSRKVTCIKRTSNFPYVTEKGMLFEVRDSAYMILYKNFVVIMNITNSNKTTNGIDSTYFHNKYFIFNNTKDSGYYYRDIKTTNPIVKNKDSFVNSSDFGYYDFAKADTNNCILQTTIADDTYNAIEFYTSKTNSKFGLPDSIFYYYQTKFANVDFSLSKIKDKKNKMKLVKIIMIPGGLNKVIDKDKIKKKLEISYEIKEECPSNIDEIIEFIEGFAKKYKQT